MNYGWITTCSCGKHPIGSRKPQGDSLDFLKALACKSRILDLTVSTSFPTYLPFSDAGKILILQLTIRLSSITYPHKAQSGCCTNVNLLLLYKQVNSHWLLTKSSTHTSFYSARPVGTEWRWAPLILLRSM